MRKLTIVTTLSIALLSGAGTIAFAAHGKEPAVDGMANMEGMAGMEGMAAGDGAMPMQGMGMMPMMMGMMEKMPMMMGMMAMMPMGGQPAGAMAGMDTMAPAPAAAAVPAGLEAKLDLLITSIDSLTARIEKLEAPAAN